MVNRQLRFTPAAQDALKALEAGPLAGAGKLKKADKTLGLLQLNPRHPGLYSHDYDSFPGHGDEEVSDSYVENNTPGAWRVFWLYGPDETSPTGERIPVITAVAITDHL